MRQPANVTLFEYWNGLRAGRAVPDRIDIEPGRIAPILQHVFLLETEAAPRINFRLAGSAVCHQLGMDLRNCDFLSFWPGRDCAALQRLFAEVADTGEVAIIESEAITRSHREVVFELIVLPLARPSGIDRFIGAAVPIIEPDWAETGPVIAHRILQRTIFGPDQRAAEPSRTRTKSSVGAAHLSPMRAKNRPAFRVLDGGRANEPRAAET